MQKLYKSLNERDKRRYAAVETTKLGHGGITHISQFLNCDPKTVQAGLLEIEDNEDLESERQRKKELDANPFVFDSVLPKWNFVAVPGSA